MRNEEHQARVGAATIHDWIAPMWLARSFLLPGGAATREDDAGWNRAGHWLIFWGLILGVVYAAVFRAAWRWFGEYQYIRFAPVAIVLTVDLAWGGYYQLRDAARLLARVDRDVATAELRSALALILITILKYALLLSLPLGEAEWPGWRGRLGILYPKPIYRPLLLMPLWGRWASCLALCIGRPHPAESAGLLRMAGGIRLRWMVTAWVGCALLTMLYASEAAVDLPRGMVVALGVLVAAYLVSFVLARRCRGQTAVTVRATSLATEFAFLALYLPVVSNVFHY